MLLKEFVQMVAEVAPYAGQPNEKDDPAHSTAYTRDGISCQICLTPDGHISAEQTAITLAFTINGTPF